MVAGSKITAEMNPDHQVSPRRFQVSKLNHIFNTVIYFLVTNKNSARLTSPLGIHQNQRMAQFGQRTSLNSDLENFEVSQTQDDSIQLNKLAQVCLFLIVHPQVNNSNRNYQLVCLEVCKSAYIANLIQGWLPTSLEISRSTQCQLLEPAFCLHRLLTVSLIRSQKDFTGFSNRFDSTSLESYFKRRLTAFSHLNNSKDDFDFCSALTPKEWELLIQHSLFQIRDPDELSLQGSAASALCRFLELAESNQDGQFQMTHGSYVARPEESVALKAGNHPTGGPYCLPCCVSRCKEKKVNYLI
ncbi:hypothetical protein VP01_1591g1 [Puccinia sorghi]|uniref:U3 small nucleolar RNA-associated protein 20 N-terminal domain-containing protein n=1 Tax=Puccinia sorghi TaxID=27349 RepID=A0A0L6VHG7_9BASI|nr:hypothetical protein VP01_1591g1 [Puccinia sorghi]